ncbi:antibiotic biosynthesis monooxygenase, partial [Candidatus Marinimicrobia bacterium]|nr:antibiotic biosynthesis monooxygenase [Candidatus Neomarinimicrobiota bacterium]
MNDRARGYLLQGKAQTAVTNFGNFVDIDVSPNGVWGDYGYLYDVSFLAGVPGQSYTSNYSWELVESSLDDEGFPIYSIWESQDAYDSWFENGDTNYVGI